MSRGKSSESQRRDFKVVIYEKDYKQLCAWVLKKTDIETGGDLFGLWADKHTAVIQFVVGPGQGCRRSSVSFYQDISYLEKIGSHMTQNEGVCHIGEWHSHHQLGLARPSGGDENTVWNNMPTYNLKRFVIFIANIESSRQDSYNVNIGCFLFELESVKGKERQLPVLQGTFIILPKESPFNEKLLEMRNSGAEKDNEKEIEIRDLEMKISQQPQVTYFTKSSSFSNKRHQPDEESGNQMTIKKKKSRKDRNATSVGNENGTQGNKNMTPDDPKGGESRGQKETHKTVTNDSNERNDFHGSQAENSSGVRKNDDGNADTSGGEGTDSAGDPRTLEVKEKHEIQPGNQQSEDNAKDSTASLNKTLERKSNKEPNNEEENAKPSEAGDNSTDADDQSASDDMSQQGNPSKEPNNDGEKSKTEEGNSTVDPRHSKKDEDLKAQPPSQVPEGDATDHNPPKNKTQEENSTEESQKDGVKAMSEVGKSTKDAEPPHKKPDDVFNQVKKDQTSSPTNRASGQGKPPTVGKQKSKGDANKHENLQNSLKGQPVQKTAAKNKSGPSPLGNGPGSANPVLQKAGKEAKKEGKSKDGSEKKGGPKAKTKSNPKKPPK